jgi:hypothetical protein
VAYTGDRDMWCGKEKKKTKHTRCPHCNGKGNTLTTQCGWHCQSGYWCSNGVGDRWHK